ncbi:MAG: outer membrane beta-barrel protein [Nitrospirae bacterium]|nr:outer membrane beta-barrel protein [Nitrospirota bacterium]
MSMFHIRLRALTLIPILLGFFCLCTVIPGYAEWYVAGYGGVGMGQNLTDVTMPPYGERLAQAQFPTTTIPTTGDTLTQSFNTSDISLNSSPIFGAKVGYFLEDPSFKWLGFELETFTSKPDIKQQTLHTSQDILYTPKNTAGCPLILDQCPQSINGQPGQFAVSESSLRVTAVAANLIARYPGKLLQPYLGIGVGAFYFNASDQFSGSQFVPGLNTQAGLKILATEEWGLFVEGKYNYATIDNLDPSGYGLSGTYSAFNLLGGVAYHF